MCPQQFGKDPDDRQPTHRPSRHRPARRLQRRTDPARLSRAGNRRLNHVLYIAAIVQIRHDTPGRAYYLAQQTDGKSRKEAMRCLKRRISDAIYRQLRADITR